MRYIRIIFVLFLLTLIWFYLARCKEDSPPLTMTLRDKPLPLIKNCIKGKWKLQYVYGGLITHKYIDTYNSYMILSPDHIIMGNDSIGVFVDTTIIWVRTDIGSNDFTYLLRYSRSNYPFPINYIIDQIKNDTLIIREYLDDGFDYYYTKIY